MPIGLILYLKKKVRVFDLKKISPKTFEPHCVHCLEKYVYCIEMYIH